MDNDDEELPSDSDEYEDVRALSYAPDASQHTAPLQPTTQSSSSDNSDNDIGAVYSHSLRTQNGFLSKQRKQCVRDQTVRCQKSQIARHSETSFRANKSRAKKSHESKRIASHRVQ